VLRAPRDREHPERAPQRPGDDAPEDDAVREGHQLGIALERQVLDRQQRGARKPRRQRVREVHEARAQRAQQPRQLHCHPHLLRRRLQLDRLDAFGHQVGPSGDRRDPQPLGLRGKLAQEVRDIRLVARPAPAEDVRVDDDKRLVAGARARRAPADRAARHNDRHRSTVGLRDERHNLPKVWSGC
jgi:hypothetical protein